MLFCNDRHPETQQKHYWWWTQHEKSPAPIRAQPTKNKPNRTGAWTLTSLTHTHTLTSASFHRCVSSRAPFLMDTNTWVLSAARAFKWDSLTEKLANKDALFFLTKTITVTKYLSAFWSPWQPQFRQTFYLVKIKEEKTVCVAVVLVHNRIKDKLLIMKISAYHQFPSRSSLSFVSLISVTLSTWNCLRE